MKTTTYNKLVRDRIPEIISASGRRVKMDILSDCDYIRMLDEKLTEELNEYQQSKDMMELADLMEVIYAIASAKGITAAELEAMRVKKVNERGGFLKKIRLREVIEE